MPSTEGKFEETQSFLPDNELNKRSALEIDEDFGLNDDDDDDKDHSSHKRITSNNHKDTWTRRILIIMAVLMSLITIVKFLGGSTSSKAAVPDIAEEWADDVIFGQFGNNGDDIEEEDFKDNDDAESAAVGDDAESAAVDDDAESTAVDDLDDDGESAAVDDKGDESHLEEDENVAEGDDFDDDVSGDGSNKDGEKVSDGDDFGDYIVLERMYHNPQSFTQGLTYKDGIIYETTGLNGRSMVYRIDIESGDVLNSYALDRKYFGEGSTLYGDNKLIEITWKQKTGFIFDSNTLELITIFDFTTTKDEGWGITHDPATKQFYVSDGSKFLHVWDEETLQQTKKIEVTDEQGRGITNLNELEFTSKGILSNIWYSHEIILIDTETGAVKRRFDFSALKKENLEDDVLNGIAVVDDKEGIFLITGKLWHKIYRVRIKDWKDI